MKLLDPRLHGICDLVAVVLFAISPFLLFDLMGTVVATAAWALAALQLLLALITRYPLGVLKAVPFFVHGLVELVLAIVLLLLPVLLGAAPGSPAKRFYTFAGIVYVVMWVLTAYREREAVR